jgi:Prokaryotic STING domain
MSLAISFFQHYLRPLAYALESNRGKEVIEASWEHRFTYDDFVIQVLVPEDLSQIMPDGSIRGEPSLVPVHISHIGRSYPFYVTKGAINVKRTPLLEVFAKPRVLAAIRDLVVFTSGLSPEQTILEKREIRNFARAIELLIEREYGPRTPHVKLCSIEAVSARQGSRTDRPRTSRRGR